MNYISFKKEKDYFEKSTLFQEIKDLVFKKITFEDDKKLLELCTKLYLESVIKHNLSISCTRIENTNLVTEDNSKEVWNFFGKINNKGKEKLTPSDFHAYKINTLVSGAINIFIISEFFYGENKNRDVMQEIKKEYFDFKNVQKSAPKLK